jgi:hypothetical protein
LLQLELLNKEKNMKYLSLIVLTILLNSCTLSFQNISTHGTATDLVDENQTPTNTVSPKFTIPIGGL